MKSTTNHGVIHFSKTRSITAEEAGHPADSGNGYYSYSYTLTPFSGEAITEEAFQNINRAVRNKWYAGYNIFTSLGFVDVRDDHTILVQHVYHHGD